jgi:hypothetical protein
LSSFGNVIGLVKLWKRQVALINCEDIDHDDIFQEFPNTHINFPMR